MADPVIISVPADQWYKVATAVKFGFVRIIEPTDNEWYQTYRLTGNPAPTTEKPEVKIEYQSDGISFIADSDVYVYHKSTAGKLRLDL